MISPLKMAARFASQDEKTLNTDGGKSQASLQRLYDEAKRLKSVLEFELLLFRLMRSKAARAQNPRAANNLCDR